jgi:hypothetical protein
MMRVQSIINGIKASFSLFAEAIAPVQSDIKKIINGMARVHAANLEMVEKCEDGDYPRCRNVLGAYYCEKCGHDVRVTKGACPSVPISERWKVNYQPISSDLATRIQSLVCDVEIDLDSPLLEDA